MDNNETLIKSFYGSNDIDIKLIKKGFNRNIYLIKHHDERYILKIWEDNGDIGVKKFNDVPMLSFLNHKKVNFVPSIIKHDQKNNIYMESYIDGDDISFSNLNKNQLDIFAKQLAEIHSLSPTEYLDFSEKHGFKKPEIITPLKNLEIYGFGRFEIARRLCPDNSVIEWLDDKLAISLSDVSKILISNSEMHLMWGDIGENIRLNKNGNLFFLDWEFSELGFSSEMSYIKIHSHIGSDEFRYLIDRYASHINIPEEELISEIETTEKIIRINDVVWAAMKWGQAKTNVDIEKYRQLTFARIKLVENK